MAANYEFYLLNGLGGVASRKILPFDSDQDAKDHAHQSGEAPLEVWQGTRRITHIKRSIARDGARKTGVKSNGGESRR